MDSGRCNEGAETWVNAMKEPNFGLGADAMNFGHGPMRCDKEAGFLDMGRCDVTKEPIFWTWGLM